MALSIIADVHRCEWIYVVTTSEFYRKTISNMRIICSRNASYFSDRLYFHEFWQKKLKCGWNRSIWILDWNWRRARSYDEEAQSLKQATTAGYLGKTLFNTLPTITITITVITIKRWNRFDLKQVTEWTPTAADKINI